MLDRLRPFFRRQPRRAAASAPIPAAPSAPSPTPAEAAAPAPPAPAPPVPQAAPVASAGADRDSLSRRRGDLARQLAELQWDLGGLTYEMALRDQFRPDLLARRAAQLQQVDAELASVDRMLQLEQAGAAGSCPKCRALYTAGAVYCWQCGAPLAPQQPAATVPQQPTTAKPPTT